MKLGNSWTSKTEFAVGLYCICFSCPSETKTIHVR